jgi:hypothetical protein
VDNKSPFQRVKELDAQVRSILSQLDMDALPAVQRELVVRIKRQAADVRLDLRDYGMAETAADQQRYAKEAHERLEVLQKNIVKASEYDLFSAIDIAQISANMQQIISEL